MRWLGEFLAAEGGDARTRARAYFIHGFLAVLKADPVAARPPLYAAVATARQAGQPDVLSDALSMASIAEGMAGDHATARRLLNEAHATTTGHAYPPGKVGVAQARVLNGYFEADLGAVRSGAAEGVRLARETGDLYGLEMMLLNLGSAALIAGDLGESAPLLAQALRIAGQIDDRVAQFYLFTAFGCHAALSGRAQLAARLLGASQTAQTRVGANSALFLDPSAAQARQAASAGLGAAAFQTEFEAGKGLSPETALGLALGESAATTPSGDPSPGPLSRREAGVARLVADGLTNKQIGARLFISERTVNSHVRSILNKLGFSSRAQIAAWTASPDQ
jgi:DNA-binding CsgD family transcriptional regulator